MSEQTSNMAHEARLKQSQINKEAEKSKIKLITQKELIKGSITRLKKRYLKSPLVRGKWPIFTKTAASHR